MEEYDALVTGGTGFLWKYILKEPLCARFRICFLGRRPPDHRSRFEFIDLAAPGAGEGFNGRSVRSRLFIHFAAPPPQAGGQVSRAKAERIAMNAASIALQNGACRLIHASSAAVYGISWAGHRSESDPAAPATEHGMAKRSAENILDSFFGDPVSGRHVTHLRLHFPVPSVKALRQAVEEGCCDRLFARLTRDILNDRPVQLQSPAFRMNPCPGPALAKLLGLFLEDRELRPGFINVAGAHSTTLEEVAIELGRQLGRQPRFERGSEPEQSMLVDTRLFHSLVGDIINLPLF